MNKFREDFPILNRQVKGRPIVYFDNAATAQRPIQVMKAVERYNSNFNGNPHRAAHVLSIDATREYEESKEAVRKFINAESTDSIIY